MVFWHLGATLWLFRWIFRDPKVDIRFLFLGAVLPDLIDIPLGTFGLTEYSASELWAHTLLLPTAYMVGVLMLTRRGRRRRAFMAVGVGWLFHLLLDGMWMTQEVFFWPFFGDFPSGEAPFWPAAWARATSDVWRWLGEAVGLGYLAWLWKHLDLGDPERRTKVMQTGRLPEHAA
ncbi:MAG: metal-dependent hydrolase [Actinomycetes bacterium]|jgi:inner membrane protein|nr:MAG: hypothetical protein DIU67_04850 [Actinomycetota bacterium]